MIRTEKQSVEFFVMQSSKLFTSFIAPVITGFAFIIVATCLPQNAWADGTTRFSNQHLQSLREALVRHQVYAGRQLDNKVSVFSEVLTLVEQKYLLDRVYTIRKL